MFRETCEANTWFALHTVDNAGKSVHAGRPQDEADDEIHHRRADDAVIHERVLGHERDPGPGEPRPGEPHVREMTAPLVIYCSLPACPW